MAVAQGAQGSGIAVGQHRGQPLKRLVEQDHAVADHQRTRQRRHLALPAGEARRGAMAQIASSGSTA